MRALTVSLQARVNAIENIGMNAVQVVHAISCLLTRYNFLLIYPNEFDCFESLSFPEYSRRLKNE